VERSDRDLVRECRLGSQEAFRELFERYHRQILAVAVGMTGNAEDARDVAQETFLRAHRNLRSFLGDSSFYTWLYRIAVNVAIDHRRRRARRAEVGATDATPGPADELAVARAGDEPESELARKELGRRIFTVIDELTPEHKAAIILREVEGLSYEEISKVMQCSKGTVMSRLHYARKRLQTKLRDLL
jgi:RNA polymerase sigma-70 factor (ECF subfamily)